MDYLPQDEYFEWEDIMVDQSHRSSTFPGASQFPSQYRTTFSQRKASLETDIKEFGWGGCDSENNEGSSTKPTPTAISWAPITTTTTTTTTTTHMDDTDSNEYSTFESDEEDFEEEGSQSSSESSSDAQCLRIKDDSDLMHQPSRNVDYLAHRWSEPDLWATRKHIRSCLQEHEHFERWENACWRSSAQLRLRLNPVCPLSFNWLRDQDDTWLYGPFQSSADSATVIEKPEPPVRPILRRPAPSEMILRGSSMRPHGFESIQRRRTAPVKRGISFSEEVEQYCAVEVNSNDWVDEEECVWIAPRNQNAKRHQVRKLPSAILKPEAPVINSIPRATKSAPRQQSSLRSSTISDWMYVPNGDYAEEPDELDDWISAAADRTSAALKAASEPVPDLVAIRQGYASFKNVQSPRSSTAEDVKGSEQLVSSDQLEMESLSPDSSDYQSSNTSDGEPEEETDSYFAPEPLVATERKRLTKVGLLDEDVRAEYDQMIEEFNLMNSI